MSEKSGQEAVPAENPTPKKVPVEKSRWTRSCEAMQRARGRVWDRVAMYPRLSPVVAFGAGVALIVVAHKWEPHGADEARHASLALFLHVVKDVGIGFLVSGVIATFFEIAARAHEQYDEATRILNLAMRSMVPKEVWQEVISQVLKRKFARRSVNVTIKVLSDVEGKRLNGESDLLPHFRVIEVTTTYDLHSLDPRPGPAEVKHSLDNHMRLGGGLLPAFEEVHLNGARPPELEGDLSRLRDGIAFFSFRHGGSSKAGVPIRTVRRELVSVPGYYVTILPENSLPAPNAEPDDPTITVEIENSESNVEASVMTWNGDPSREFVRGKDEGNKQVWHFVGTMLAGQGFGVLFQRKLEPGLSATANSV